MNKISSLLMLAMLTVCVAAPSVYAQEPSSDVQMQVQSSVEDTGDNEDNYPQVKADVDESQLEPGTTENPICDLRGDEGVLMSFRPSGVVFLSPDRVLISDFANQQLHIFDLEGRRFRKVSNIREFPNPEYSGIATLDEGKFLVVGDHYHTNNVVRYVGARSVLHFYQLLGERFTDDSSKKNFDPNIPFRSTGLLGENIDVRMKIEGVAVDQDSDTIYFALSQPYCEDGSVMILKGGLTDVMERDKRLKLEILDLGIMPKVDPLTNEPFRLTDISYVPGKGLLLLTSSKSSDDRKYGTSQIWFKPDGASSASLIAEEIAPGNYATGVSAIKVGNLYNIALVFDNNPDRNSAPSRLMIVKGIEL